MKIFLLAFLVSFNSFAGITIISDLDDTIKITNAGDLRRATINGVFSEKVFTGMPEFLKVARSYSDSLHVVSAGPKLIKSRVISLLKKFNIQYDGIHMRAIPGKEGKFEFKVRAIQEIIKKNAGDVILLGDDVDLDPEIYAEISKIYPDRVLGVYIHIVKNRPVPEKFTRYWTSMDLALQENIAGRLDNESALAVIRPLLAETRLTRIIPRFADCPTTSVVWEWQVTTMFSVEAIELSHKLNEFCLQGK
jgi:phosphatidate phosphatase APP1